MTTGRHDQPNESIDILLDALTKEKNESKRNAFLYNLLSKVTEKTLLQKANNLQSKLNHNDLAFLLLLSSNASYLKLTDFLLNKTHASTTYFITKGVTVFDRYLEERTSRKKLLEEIIGLPENSPVNIIDAYYYDPIIDLLMYKNYITKKLEETASSKCDEKMKEQLFNQAIHTLSMLIAARPTNDNLARDEKTIFLNEYKKTLKELHENFLKYGNVETLVKFQEEFKKTGFQYIDTETLTKTMAEQKNLNYKEKRDEIEPSDIEKIRRNFLAIKIMTTHEKTLALTKECDKELQEIINDSDRDPFLKLVHVLDTIADLNNKILDLGWSFGNFNARSSTAKRLREQLLIPAIEKYLPSNSNLFYGCNEDKDTFPLSRATLVACDHKNLGAFYIQMYNPSLHKKYKLNKQVLAFASSYTPKITNHITSILTTTQNETKSSTVTTQQQEVNAKLAKFGKK